MSNARRTLWPLFGFAFGAVLCFFGFVRAGVGHGSYLPLMIFAAPVSFVPFLGLFAAPPFWGWIGWLLANGSRRSAIATLSVHTAAAGLVLLFDTPSKALSFTGESFDAGLPLYAVGLIVAWTLTIGPSSRRDDES